MQVSAFTLALRQVRYENTTFWRNPVAAIFTFVFPLMFLVIFNLIFGNREMTVPGGTVTTSTFYVPSILALSVIGACYTNVAMGVCFSREARAVQAHPGHSTAGLGAAVRQARNGDIGIARSW